MTNLVVVLQSGNLFDCHKINSVKTINKFNTPNKTPVSIS